MSSEVTLPHDPHRHGSVVRDTDGTHRVVFERLVNHAVEHVWASITEPAQRAVWCPGICFEPKPGARYDIWFGDECEGPSHLSGTLAPFVPPRELGIGSIRIQLTPMENERCRLTFIDTLFFDDKRTKTDFANAVLGGWQQFVDRWMLWLDEGRAALDLKELDYSRIDVPGRP